MFQTQEAIRYFSKMQRSQEDSQEDLEPRESKFSRIAGNQMVSLKQMITFCSVASSEQEQRATQKKKQLEAASVTHKAKEGLHLTMIEKIAIKRKRFDLPITFDDLKYGTNNMMPDNLHHMADQMALAKKQRLKIFNKKQSLNESEQEKLLQLQAAQEREKYVKDQMQMVAEQTKVEVPQLMLSKTVRKSPLRQQQVVIQEMKGGMGEVSKTTFQPFKNYTSREYEWKRRIPNNGPPPSPTKFRPSYALVQSSSPRFFNSTQSRFPNDKETIVKTKEKLRNPRLDIFEGEHNLIGEKPSCSTCTYRHNKVEQQWLIQPIKNSVYGRSLFGFHNSRNNSH